MDSQQIQVLPVCDVDVAFLDRSSVLHNDPSSRVDPVHLLIRLWLSGHWTLDTDQMSGKAVEWLLH